MRLGGMQNQYGDECPDALFLTSLLDVASTRIEVENHFQRRLPTILYMHENQAEYPMDPGGPDEERDVHFALTNLTSILAADLVLWNSRWNLESFIVGIQEILSHSRGVELGDIASKIRSRSNVAWCPVEVPRPSVPSPIPEDDRALVVWPHRHEYDKGPDELLELAERCHGKPIRWALLGERFSKTPKSIQLFRERFSDQIVFDDYPTRPVYESILASASWVCSTAKHEFFGLSVVEAMFSGCLPWVPTRLSYRELLPAAARDLSPLAPPENVDDIHEAIRWHLGAAEASVAAARIDRLLENAVS